MLVLTSKATTIFLVGSMAWNTNGYTPDDFNTVIKSYYDSFISQPEFETVSTSRFEGSAEYAVFYGSAQIDMAIQSIYAETFQKVMTYLSTINLKIQSPTTVPDAISESIKNNLGFDSKCKPMTEENRGTSHIAIDYEESPDANLAIANLLKKHIVDGVITVGSIKQDVVFSNGSIGTYSWVSSANSEVLFKLTVTVSRNSSFAVDTAGNIIAKFNDNFSELYSMGLDLEPERYYEIERDAQYASDILTEYSFDAGLSWSSEPFESEFNVKFTPVLSASNIIIK